MPAHSHVLTTVTTPYAARDSRELHVSVGTLPASSALSSAVDSVRGLQSTYAKRGGRGERLRTQAMGGWQCLGHVFGALTHPAVSLCPALALALAFHYSRCLLVPSGTL